MAKKLTKAQGRKRLAEIRSKTFALLGAGYVSTKDMDSIDRIVKTRTNQLK